MLAVFYQITLKVNVGYVKYEFLSKKILEVGKITQTIAQKNIFTYFGRVFSSLFCVSIS
jgi:hypothetical protein